jgi:hypothetical protein
MMAEPDQSPILARFERTLELAVYIAEGLGVPAEQLAPAREILRENYDAWLRRQLEGLGKGDA